MQDDIRNILEEAKDAATLLREWAEAWDLIARDNKIVAFIAHPDAPYTVREWSSNLTEVLGPTEDDLRSGGWHDWIHPDDKARVVEDHAKLITGSFVEFRMRNPDTDECYYIREHAKMVCDAKGNATALVGWIRRLEDCEPLDVRY